jgi:predicted XRE-type DNA-binding protein
MAKEGQNMSTSKVRSLKLVRGSGNVFRDFKQPDAERQQLKALLSAMIIRSLDEGGLSVRKAEQITGTAAADFSRIRNANLARFTVDRLMTILGRLGEDIEVAVSQRRPKRRKEADRPSVA